MNIDRQYLNHKMLSLVKLIEAIEELDKKGIISFEEFNKLHYSEIQKRFFTLPNPVQVEKAKRAIEYMRAK